MYIEFGYQNQGGTNDSVIVSPTSASMTQTALRDLIIAALNITGCTPLWVESSNANVASALSTRLVIPTPRPAVDPTPSV